MLRKVQMTTDELQTRIEAIIIFMCPHFFKLLNIHCLNIRKQVNLKSCALACLTSKYVAPVLKMIARGISGAAFTSV